MRNKIILAGILTLLGADLIGVGAWDALQAIHLFSPPSSALAGTWSCQTTQEGVQEHILITLQSHAGIADVSINYPITSFQQQDIITITSTSMWFSVSPFSGTEQPTSLLPFEGKMTISYQQENNTLVLAGTDGQEVLCYPQTEGP